MRLFFKAEDATTLSNNATVTSWSGTPTFFQLYMDFQSTQTAELFQDGVSQGSFSIATLANKTFTNTGFRMGGQYTGGSESLDGTVFRHRTSVGAGVLNNDIRLGI